MDFDATEMCFILASEVACTCNANTLEAEAGGVCHEFEACVGYTVNSKSV